MKTKGARKKDGSNADTKLRKRTANLTGRAKVTAMITGDRSVVCVGFLDGVPVELKFSDLTAAGNFLRHVGGIDGGAV